MLKKTVLLLLAVSLLLCGLLAAQAELLSQAERYEALQEQLHACLNGESGAMPLNDLTKQFESLGRYMKSAQFGYYAAILRDAEAGDDSHLALYTRLLRMDADFCAMLPEQGFPSVDEVEAYALGRQAQEKGDWNAAIGYYEQSIAVMDSMARIMELLTAEPTATETPLPAPTPTPVPTPTPTATPKCEGSGWRSAGSPYVLALYENDTCIITGYDRPHATAITIPTTMWSHEYEVIGIADYAFTRLNINSVSIPNTAIFIGDNPFARCEHLTHIYVADTHPTLEIQQSVLFDKTNKRLICYPLGLTSSSYEIPYGTRIIGSFAFANCDSLTSVTIPNGITSIDRGAFEGCTALTTITLPDSITSTGPGAFRNCTALTSVTIPNGITSIDSATFEGCTALTTITLPDSITSIGPGAFHNCTALTSVTIPNGITSIDYGTFEGCTALTTITLPDSITSIHSEAFRNCPFLIFCVPKDSYAHQYALSHNIPYTTY